MIHRAINKMTNTNILNEFSDSWIKKSRDENTSSTELKASFRFDNMTLLSQNQIHFLYKSVIYDSECSDFLTFDRNRFVDEIRSADEWIKISNELMNIVNYETMIVNDKLSNKIVKLKFANTIWISSTDVILISSTRLIKKNYDRDSHTNTFMCQAHRNSIVYLVIIWRRSKKWKRRMRMWKLIYSSSLNLVYQF
jgi:hypothetical protein